MNAPARKPWFADPVAGREVTVPDTGPEIANLMDMIAALTEGTSWRAEHGTRTSPITVVRGDAHLELRAQSEHKDIVVTLAPDPSGWIRVTGDMGRGQTLRAYADKPYEAIELWPANSAEMAPDAEAPGQVGKRFHWVSLSVSAWPILAAFCDGHYLTLEEVECG